MKKFVLITFCLASLAVNGQIKLNEGFDGSTFPPAGWSRTSVLGANQWVQSTTQYLSGTASAFIDYQSSGGEDWLITPQLSIVTGDSLSFFARKNYTGPYPPDSLLIRVSTTGTALSNFTTLIGAIDVTTLSSTAWTQLKGSLSAFASQNIYIAFVHKDVDGHGMWMDSVKVGNPIATDVAALSISPTGTGYYTSSSTAIPMSGVVRNNGSSAATFTVTRTITPGTYSSTQSVSALAPSSNATVNFSNFTGYSLGTTYTIKDSVYLAGDGFAGNDVITANFTPTLPKKVLVYHLDNASRDSMVAHLNAAGLSAEYDVMEWAVNAPDFNMWKTVFVLCPDATGFSPAIKDSLRSFVNNSTVTNKKTLGVFGNDLGYMYDRNASSFKDTAFYRQYLKAIYIGDSWISSIPTAAGKISGRNAFASMPIDSVFDAYPDFVKPHNGGLAASVPNYPGAGGDSASAVYFNGSYNLYYGTATYSGYVRNGAALIDHIKNWAYANGGSMPVDMISFTAVAVKKDVELNWSTASEVNNHGFTIERSGNDMKFEKVAFVKGAGNSTGFLSYAFTDKAAFLNMDNVIYYRLKQEDMDGKFSYSDTRKVLYSERSIGSVVSLPNPFTDQFTLTVNSLSNAAITLTLINLSGQVVTSETRTSVKGANTYDMLNLVTLPEGVYFLKVEQNGETTMHKIFKANP